MSVLMLAKTDRVRGRFGAQVGLDICLCFFTEYRFSWKFSTLIAIVLAFLNR